MIAEGRVNGSQTDLAIALQKDAAIFLNAGPTPLAGPRLDALRYEITDLLDDLRGERTHAEIRAIGAKLFEPLADLILFGRGKWVPRLQTPQATSINNGSPQETPALRRCQILLLISSRKN